MTADLFGFLTADAPFGLLDQVIKGGVTMGIVAPERLGDQDEENQMTRLIEWYWMTLNNLWGTTDREMDRYWAYFLGTENSGTLAAVLGVGLYVCLGTAFVASIIGVTLGRLRKGFKGSSVDRLLDIVVYTSVLPVLIFSLIYAVSVAVIWVKLGAEFALHSSSEPQFIWIGLASAWVLYVLRSRVRCSMRLSRSSSVSPQSLHRWSHQARKKLHHMVGLAAASTRRCSGRMPAPSRCRLPLEIVGALNSGRQLSLLIEDGANGIGVSLADDEHRNSMAVRNAADKRAGPLRSS